MKKMIFFLVLIAFLVFGLSACSENGAEDMPQTACDPEFDEVYEVITLYQWPMPTAEQFGEKIIHAEQVRAELLLSAWFLSEHSEVVSGEPSVRRILPSAGISSISDLQERLRNAHWSNDIIETFFATSITTFEERADGFYFTPYIACGGAWVWALAEFEVLETFGYYATVEAQVLNVSEGVPTSETFHYLFWLDSTRGIYYIKTRELVNWHRLSDEEFEALGGWDEINRRNASN